MIRIKALLETDVNTLHAHYISAQLLQNVLKNKHITDYLREDIKYLEYNGLNDKQKNL